jgi:hypothetical protein
MNTCRHLITFQPCLLKLLEPWSQMMGPNLKYIFNSIPMQDISSDYVINTKFSDLWKMVKRQEIDRYMLDKF